jgi:hypothetical protein
MKTIAKVINAFAMIAVLALMIYDFNAFLTGTANPFLLGVIAVICTVVFIVFLSLDALSGDEEAAAKGKLREIESDFITERAILDIDTDDPFVVKTATKARMLIKNIADTSGIRLRFSSVLTVLSPDDIELHITPGETAQVSVNVIPLSKGKHEVFVDFCNLGEDEMCLSVQKFEFSAREQLVAGLTSTQMNAVKNLLKLGVFIAVGTGLIFVFIPKLQDFQDIVTTFIPLLLIGQALVVYYFYALLNRLPQA